MSVSAHEAKLGFPDAARRGLSRLTAAGDENEPRTRVVGLSACVVIAIIFTLDATSPASFSYWPYGLPVMLAALTSSQRLTVTLVVLALAANLLGAGVDRLAGDVNWTNEYIQNRILAFVGPILSGFLTAAVQSATTRAAHAGALAIQNARELAVSRAADQIVAALSTDRVIPTVVTEAVKIFDAASALWVPANPMLGGLRARRAGSEIDVSLEPLDAALAAFVHGSAATADPRVQWKAMPASLAGAGVEANSVLCVPVAVSTESAGTLVVVPSSDTADEALLPSAQSFARIASSALEESRLLQELAQQNRSLQDRQHVIQDLVDAISHDVRTPLEALSMTLQQAVDGLYGPLPADYAEVLTESRISIDEIYGLAETLLVVARFEAGAIEPSKVPIALDRLADELLIEFRALANARKLELRSRLEANAVVQGSGPNLRRAIANLVANAVRHTPPGGIVELAVERKGGSIELTVSDNGFGVDESVRPMLFQRFARGVGTGSGLGLYIVRRVAESMGGTARYAPREPRGSAFTIALPRSGAEPA